jgi:hypothetical protein
VLDDEEVLAGCKVLCIGRFEFIDVGAVVIHCDGSDLEIIVADDPELEPVLRVTGCDAMDGNRITVGNRDRP